jgi:tetratricopeptide (TPR) repeat protein
MDHEIKVLLDKSYESLRGGDVAGAAAVLEEALSVNYENEKVVALLKCSHFWKDRERTAAGLQDSFEKAEYLLNQWKIFLQFADRIDGLPGDTLPVFKHFVCTACLGHYQTFIGDNPALKDPDVLLQIGRCYKGKGEFDRALQHFEAAHQLRREDAAILSELADCYSLINEAQKAKAFFREAFFINPQKIDVRSLESRMMQLVIEKVREQGHASPLLEEWIPVYAVVYGVFSVKRELRSIEYGKLKQSIYSMEVELRESGNQANPALVPRLLYRYFWLVDHYVSTKEDQERIFEILLKIKNLNREIYEQYTK